MQERSFEVTGADIDSALIAGNGNREHQWRNPVAICVERTLGEGTFCVVTKERIHISKGSNLLFVGIEPGEFSRFMDDWRAVRPVQPIRFNITLDKGFSFDG